MKGHGIFGILFFSSIFLASCASNPELADRTDAQKKADIYYNQGTNDLVKKNYSQALINLLKAREFNDKDSLIRTNLGMAYYFKEQPQLAEAEFKKAIELDKKNSDAKVDLGTLYMEKNRLKEARALYEEVAADLTYSNQFRNFYNLAVLALKVGDRAEAYEFLFKSIKEREDYCQAHFKLGELYSEEYKYKQALSSFTEASKGTCISEPAPNYYQAVTLMNLNRFEEARIKFKFVVEKFPKSNFSSLAQNQMRKLTSEIKEQALNQNHQTEVIKESREIKEAQSPNF